MTQAPPGRSARFTAAYLRARRAAVALVSRWRARRADTVRGGRPLTVARAALAALPLLGAFIPLLASGLALLRPFCRRDEDGEARNALVLLGAVPASAFATWLAVRAGRLAPLVAMPADAGDALLRIYALIGLLPLGIIAAGILAERLGRCVNLVRALGLAVTASFLVVAGALSCVIGQRPLVDAEARWTPVGVDGGGGGAEGGLPVRLGAGQLAVGLAEGSWRATDIWSNGPLEVARVRRRDLWIVCEPGASLRDCQFVDRQGFTGPADALVIGGIDAVPLGWAVPPAVGLLLAGWLAFRGARELIRWKGRRAAEHLGGGLVRLSPGGEPRLVRAAAGLPHGPIVVELRGRPRAPLGPFRGVEAADGEAWPGHLAEHVERSRRTAEARLGAALLALAYLGTPFVTAALLLR